MDPGAPHRSLCRSVATGGGGCRSGYPTNPTSRHRRCAASSTTATPLPPPTPTYWVSTPTVAWLSMTLPCQLRCRGHSYAYARAGPSCFPLGRAVCSRASRSPRPSPWSSLWSIRVPRPWQGLALAPARLSVPRCGRWGEVAVGPKASHASQRRQCINLEEPRKGCFGWAVDARGP